MEIYNTDSLPAHIIAGIEIPPEKGVTVTSINPYTGQELWSSKDASISLIEQAIASSRQSFEEWSNFLLEERIEIIKNFTTIVEKNRGYLSTLVAQEAGKPLWESNIEVNSLITKLTASVDAYKIRNAESSREVKGLLSKTRFKPHGVVSVLGPYNFPLSMANGHIMPSLIAGNTVIFKPSELTPLAGIVVAKMWQEAGLPKGVLNCITGGKNVGKALVEHNGIDGVFFVGSHAAGISILKSVADAPNKITAVEMGGNSPLVIEDYDPKQVNEVISIIIHSSFITSGQRCSAARRLLINEKNTPLISQLIEVIETLKFGNYTDIPEPFSGSMIRPEAAELVKTKVGNLCKGGATQLTKGVITGPNKTIFTPCLLDVNNCKNDTDEEIFGPVLKLIRYRDLKTAIQISNETKFGLSAGIVTQHLETYNEFYRKIKAGIINWNQQLTGATTFAPFGGVKQSGNYRPAGYLSADYCSFSLASFEVEAQSMKLPDTPGITFNR